MTSIDQGRMEVAMTQVLVTGGAGFVASRCAELMLNSGVGVAVGDNFVERQRGGRRHRCESNAGPDRRVCAPVSLIEHSDVRQR